MSMVEVRIRPRTVFLGLVAISLVFSFAHLCGMISTFYFGHDNLKGLVPAFHMDQEGNPPAWFASILLFLSGLCLALVGAAQRKLREPTKAWWALSLIFFFLSLDEATSLHERFGTGLASIFGATGRFLHYGWVPLYGALGVVLLVIFVPFLKRLPRQCQNLMVLAGVLFVSGALGFELLGSLVWAEEIQVDLLWRYYALAGVEETLELIGSSLFIYSLLVFMDISSVSFSPASDDGVDS